MAFVTAITACQKSTGQSSRSNNLSNLSNRIDCQTITHKAGETEICGYPDKIVVLGPSVLESLLALDVQPVAYADYLQVHTGNYDNPNQQIPYLGEYITQPLNNIGVSSNPSIEAIVASQPDLILGTTDNADQYNVLSEIAPTLLFDSTEPEVSLRSIAQAINRTEQAERMLIQVEQQIVAARKDFATVAAAHPTLLLLSSFNLQDMYLGNSAHGICSSLIEEMGFQLVAPPEFEDSNSIFPVPLSLETLPQLNKTDSVIMLGSNFSPSQLLNSDAQFEADQLAEIKQSWQDNAITQSLDASKTGRVYFIPAYLCLGLSGPIGTELYLEELKQHLLPP
ncbi:iron-siderophore ABC transporter substrate-binding protein [Leptothoe sp. LEGE 181152]|nr:iron-siderophore ABC transporter substrate-binding protein [Leptothoe sp. LEGE 181152]